jgi:hypothetical protein
MQALEINTVAAGIRIEKKPLDLFIFILSGFFTCDGRIYQTVLLLTSEFHFQAYIPAHPW